MPSTVMTLKALNLRRQQINSDIKLALRELEQLETDRDYVEQQLRLVRQLEEEGD